MANIFNKIITKLRETKYRYLFSRSNVRFSSDSTADISHDARIANSTVVVSNGKVTIGKNCKLVNVSIYINNGELNLGDWSIVKDCFIEINEGKVSVSHHSKLQCKHIYARFGGAIDIGCYTNLNHGTVVRAEQSVKIGSYCQISYYVNIWDTNTHNFHSIDERKRLAEVHYPEYGFEETHPPTKPVEIGDFCWIGEYASIMKGTTIGDNVIVGYHTMLLGDTIANNKKIVQKIELREL